MRILVAAMCLICSSGAVLAQAEIQPVLPQGVSPQNSEQARSQPQIQQESIWPTQFSTQNWNVAETRLEPQLVHFELRMNRFYSGGAGEPRVIIERRANAIVRAGDFASYQLVDYTESLNSFLFGSQRVVEATIRLFPKI